MSRASAATDQPGTLFSLRDGSAEGWLRAEFHPAAERNGGYVHGGAVASLAEAIAQRVGSENASWFTEIDFLSPVTSRGLDVRVEVSDEDRRVALLGVREGEILFTARAVDLGGEEAAAARHAAGASGGAERRCEGASEADRSHREEFRSRAGISIAALDEQSVELCWHRPAEAPPGEPPPIGALVDCSGILLRLPQAREHVGYTRSLEYTLADSVAGIDCVHARGSLDLRDERYALFHVELSGCDGTHLGQGQAVYRLREDGDAEPEEAKAA